MTPCVPSQDLIHLRKLNESRSLSAGNHQNSSDGWSFEKAQGDIDSKRMVMLAERAQKTQAI